MRHWPKPELLSGALIGLTLSAWSGLALVLWQGLERQSAELCVTGSEQALHALGEIKQLIAQVSTATSGIAQASEQQYQQNQQMRDELTAVQGLAAHTEQAMTELNITAKEQEKLAIELLHNAKAFRV